MAAAIDQGILPGSMADETQNQDRGGIFPATRWSAIEGLLVGYATARYGSKVTASVA